MTFYITTPIYYVNDVPHLGHAYTTIVADALDLLAVFVEAGQEERVVADGPVEPRQRVRHDRRVKRAQVGQGVDVVDRRRDVERGRHAP